MVMVVIINQLNMEVIMVEIVVITVDTIKATIKDTMDIMAIIAMDIMVIMGGKIFLSECFSFFLEDLIIIGLLFLK